jgi:hypothetical protein
MHSKKDIPRPTADLPPASDDEAYYRGRARWMEKLCIQHHPEPVKTPREWLRLPFGIYSELRLALQAEGLSHTATGWVLSGSFTRDARRADPRH